MKMVKHSCVSAAAVLLLAAALVTAAAGNTYYRWLDENGTQVNSDQPPPPGINYETISTGSGLHRPSASETAPLQTPANPDEQSGNQAATAQSETLAKDPEACKQARKNLDTLSTQARVRIRDSEGNFRFLTEEEKAAQRELAEAAIARECE